MAVAIDRLSRCTRSTRLDFGRAACVFSGQKEENHAASVLKPNAQPCAAIESRG